MPERFMRKHDIVRAGVKECFVESEGIGRLIKLMSGKRVRQTIPFGFCRARDICSGVVFNEAVHPLDSLGSYLQYLCPLLRRKLLGDR